TREGQGVADEVWRGVPMTTPPRYARHPFFQKGNLGLNTYPSPPFHYGAIGTAVWRNLIGERALISIPLWCD
ncbi:MAG: hypothetical protein ACPLSK_03100, partial [bacterium]